MKITEVLYAFKVALKHWTSITAPSFCDPEDVKESYEKMHEKGTIGYIADLNEMLLEKLETKQVILMRTDLNMRKGKMVAQGSHASTGAYLKANKLEQLIWEETGTVKICVQVQSEDELLQLVNLAKGSDIPTHVVIDEGRTEFKGIKTITCAAIGPGSSAKINAITSHLKLL